MSRNLALIDKFYAALAPKILEWTKARLAEESH